MCFFDSYKNSNPHREHYAGLTISIYVVKVNKIEYRVTMLTFAWVRFPMVCVAIVARIFFTAYHFVLLAMGVTQVNVIRVPFSTG